MVDDENLVHDKNFVLKKLFWEKNALFTKKTMSQSEFLGVNPSPKYFQAHIQK